MVAELLDMPHLAEARAVLARPVAPDVEVLARLHRIYLRSDGRFLLRWSPVGEDSGWVLLDDLAAEGVEATSLVDGLHWARSRQALKREERHRALFRGLLLLTPASAKQVPFLLGERRAQALFPLASRASLR